MLAIRHTLALVVLGTLARANGTLTTVETIFPNPGGNSDYYGWEVVLEGDWLFASRPNVEPYGLGFIDAYRRTSGVWTLSQTLTGSLSGPGSALVSKKSLAVRNFIAVSI